MHCKPLACACVDMRKMSACPNGSPTSRARSGSARPRSAASSTTSPASRSRPARRCSPRSTSWATSARPSCAASAPGSSASSCPSCRTRSSRPSPRSVGGALAQQGYTPVLCTQTAGGVSEADYVDLLLQQQVSGVVFAGGLYAQADAPHDHYRRLAERGLPTVLVNAGIDELGFPRVSCDDAVAVEQAIGHLISLGHTRIGLLLGPRTTSRRGASSSAARSSPRRPASTCGPDDVVARAVLARGGAGRPRPRLLARGVTGIVCASDPMALGAIRAVRRAGLEVPDDVSVVGFDDSALHELHRPAADDRPPADRARWAGWSIELLVGQIAGTPVPHDELLFEPELVVRGSPDRCRPPTDGAASPRSLVAQASVS